MAIETSFRYLVRDNLRWGFLDVGLHLLAAVLMPFWWMQWLPDVFLPFIWLRSWRRDALLPSTDLLLVLHRFMHTFWFPLGWAIGSLLFTAPEWHFWFAVHWLIHLAIDQVTHREERFKKSLWTF